MDNTVIAPIPDILAQLRAEFQERYNRARLTMITHLVVAVVVTLVFAAEALLLRKDPVHCLVAAAFVLGVQSFFAVPHGLRYLRVSYTHAHIRAAHGVNRADVPLATQVLHAMLTLQHSPLTDTRISTWIQVLEEAYSNLRKPNV